MWKKGNGETCVNTEYTIYRTKNDLSSPSCSNNSRSLNSGSIDPDFSSIQTCSQGYTTSVSHCETIGCGPFSTDWNSNSNKMDVEINTVNSSCNDHSCISTSIRDSDRIVCAIHKEVEFYDDFVRIGDKIHEQTFSIQVSTIIALANNSCSNIKPKSQQLKSKA